MTIGPENRVPVWCLRTDGGKEDVIIICEGPDGAGKTTLANEFVKLGFEYVHNGAPQPGEDLFETYTKQILRFGLQDVVFDRLHLGEIIYGTIVRGKSLLTIEQIRLLNRLIYSRGATTFFCLPKFDTVFANWSARHGQEYVRLPMHMRQIYDMYRSLLQEYQGLNHQVIDYENYLGPNEWQTPRDTPFLNEGVIGNPKARYLFVGEKAGGPHDLAFYSDQRSSHFLNECLWEAGYSESELAFTNAYTMNGQPRRLAVLTGALQNREYKFGNLAGPIRQAYRTFDGPQTVITLGELAHRRCEIEELEHFQAPHPQYIKRFKSRQRWRYVELLKSFREA
jgi:hypothetical protein